MSIDPNRMPTDEDRQMLREAVRGFLSSRWSLPDASSSQPGETARFWQEVVAQGLADFGRDKTEGGLRELAIAMEEFGFAACPLPLFANGIANLLLARIQDGGTPVMELEQLLAKRSMLSIAFGEYDHDRNAGSVHAAGKSLSGRLRFVEGAATATRLLIFSGDPASLAIVATDARGVEVTATPSMGEKILFEVSLSDVAATPIRIPEDLIRDLNLVARLCLLARAYGAARRSFEMVVAYSRDRRQFGQPIGRFQAIQHKLANCMIGLEGVRLTLQNAAASYDLQQADWRYFGSAAVAFGGTALRQTSLETHHTWGAIGYADEHEAPRHFRRIHNDVVRFGGVSQARMELADLLLRPDGSLPEYDLGCAGNEFRSEVRQWLETHWSGERKSASDGRPYDQRDYHQDFARDMGAKGWIGMSWPSAFGGQERSSLERLAFMEEMERAEAPRIGAEIQAMALMRFGTQAQQERYLPEILAGESMFGMGYSEPEAGSDLASLRTTAVRDGQTWIINGQKIWTTTWWGKYMFLAARTNRDLSTRHRGISLFIVPMNTPGITVKPARTMYDGSFANIFYDDVRVPLDALVGEVDGGWQVLTGALSTERGLVGGGIVTRAARIFSLLCDYVRTAEPGGKPLRDDPVVRDRIAQIASEIEVGRQLMLHCASAGADATSPSDAAISKVFSGELLERLGEASLDILGMVGTLSEGAPDAVLRGKFEHALRHSLMWVISIGTNEIQRNIIAQQGLGLPR
jgi:alkylation response protein AidB-like acyl-CoA dehydrogenase